MELRLSPDERVAALYSRVIHRVCVRLLEPQHEDEPQSRAEEEAARVRLQEAVARVEQRWRERLTCYTGYEYASVAPGEETAGGSLGGDGESTSSFAPQEPLVTADEDKATEDPGLPGSGFSSSMGRPLALTELATPSSIYAKMVFNAKRKIDQLDGTVEHDDAIAPSGLASVVEADGDDPDQSDRNSASVDLTTSSVQAPRGAAPTLDVAHVAALSITRFPLQCSAHDINFIFKKGILRGKWKNAILTLLRRVNRLERIAPGHVLWLTKVPDEADGAAGRVVEVVEAPAPDGSLVVRIGREGGQTLAVHVADTRRFHESIVAECDAHFQFLTS